MEIPKPDGGVRSLGVPTVTDRFIQQAIAQVLTPIYEEHFHDHSYGFRPNRCAQQAILTALDIMNDGNDWIVDIDLEKFFDTVNHDKLMTIIGRTIKDGDVISIIRKYLVSGIMIDDEYEDSIVGTPQGGNLSPLLANIMLNELDKEMEKRGLNFVRYADDCIIMVGSEMSANRVMRSISRFIEEKLGLKVNMTKSKVDRPSGLKYLGFGFYYDTRAHQFKAKPHAKSVAKFKKRMKELTCRSWGVSNSYKIEKLNQLIRGWINYFKIGSMKTLCRKLDGNIRYRLRMCIWKHWKTPQKRAKNLIKLGINEHLAWSMAYYGAHIARVCHGGAMHNAITTVLSVKDKTSIEEALKKELNIQQIDLENVFYIHTHMNLEEPENELRGKLTATFEKIKKCEPEKPNALYRLVFDTIQEKACYEFSKDDYDNLIAKKGLTRSKFDELLNKHAEASKTGVEAAKRYIDAIPNIGHRKVYKTALANILQILSSSKPLKQLESKIAKYLQGNIDKLGEMEHTLDMLTAQFHSEFSIEIENAEKTVLYILVIYRFMEGVYDEDGV